MLCEKISDKELVSRYLRGDESALEILISRHQERIYTYIVSLVKDRQLAEDIFQDVFIKVVNTFKRGKYHEEGKFLPWVMRISHNLVIDTFRKLKRNPHVDGGDSYNIFDTIKQEEPNAEEKLVFEQMTGVVTECIQELPEEQRKVLEMRHYADLSFKEIAEETGVSINTALGRMRYALINLRKIISERQPDILR